MPSTWYALSVIDDARNATESLLRPVDAGRWLRLAVVALFVGVGGSVPFGNGGGGNLPSNGTDVPTGVPSPDATLVGVIVAVVAAVVFLALLWTVVGAVMEFVLVVALRDREVRLRGPFRDHLGRGLRLFGFRLAVGLTALLVVGVPTLAVFGLGVTLSPALFVLAVPLVLVGVAVAVTAGAATRLTTDFVVPAMLVDRCGVLDGWRRLWPTLRAEWKQVGVYVVARFVLGVAAGIAVGLVTLVAALGLAVPVALLGGVLFALLSAAGVAVALVVFAPLVLLYVLVVLTVGLFVQVPAMTFVRYYSLAVLGNLVPELDFVGVDDGADAADPADATDR